MERCVKCKSILKARRNFTFKCSTCNTCFRFSAFAITCFFIYLVDVGISIYVLVIGGRFYFANDLDVDVSPILVPLLIAFGVLNLSLKTLFESKLGFKEIKCTD